MIEVISVQDGSRDKSGARDSANPAADCVLGVCCSLPDASSATARLRMPLAPTIAFNTRRESQSLSS
jgi:hypothetical protein